MRKMKTNFVKNQHFRFQPQKRKQSRKCVGQIYFGANPIPEFISNKSENYTLEDCLQTFVGFCLFLCVCLSYIYAEITL